MSILVQFSIFPLDKGVSLSSHVAEAVRIIEASGLSYQIGPMGTAIEGEWDEVMRLLGECYRAMDAASSRFYIALTADCRRGSGDRIRGKVRSLEEKLHARPAGDS